MLASTLFATHAALFLRAQAPLFFLHVKIAHLVSMYMLALCANKMLT